MRVRYALPATLLAILLALGKPAAAQPARFISEVRLGVMANDVGIFSERYERGANVNGEVLFVSPTFLTFAFSPRPHFGFSANTAGDTSQVYFGLSWQFTLWRGLFAGFGLGGAVHDGYLDILRPDRKALGSRLLFRESIEIGYQITERHSLSVMLDHISNAGLARRNEGLDTVGVRYGFRF